MLTIAEFDMNFVMSSVKTADSLLRVAILAILEIFHFLQEGLSFSFR